MAILVAGTSIADFSYVAPSVAKDVTSGHFPTILGEGMQVDGPSQIREQWDTAKSNLWTTHYVKPSSPFGSSGSHTYLGVKTDFPVVVKIIGVSTNTGGIAIYMRDPSASYNYNVVVSTPEEVFDDALHRIDINFKLHNTLGRVAVYVDGLLVLEYKGDTIRDLAATTAVDAVCFESSGLFGATLSHVIVADQDTRLFRLSGMEITGNGSHTDWTGTYTDVAETGYDSNFLHTNTLNAISTFEFAAPTISGDYEAYALVLAGRASVYGSTIAGIEMVSDDGTVHNLAAFPNPDVLPTGRNFVVEINPATGVRWTAADFASTDFGVKAV